MNKQFALCLLTAVFSCSPAGHLSKTAETFEIHTESISEGPGNIAGHQIQPDTCKSDVMNAVTGDNGEKVAFDILTPAYITATHKQVAEKNGKVTVCFSIHLKHGIVSERYQLRIVPIATTIYESRRLDSLLFTGTLFRERQEQGYDRFEKYMAKVDFLSNEEKLLYRRSLEIFLSRNDAMNLGISEDEAVGHYTRKWLARMARNKKDNIAKYYDKYISEPYIHNGIVLDSVITDPDNTITYNYTATIPTRPRMKYIDICIESSLHINGNKALVQNNGDTMRFYISSLSSLSDNRTRYIRQYRLRDSFISTSANFTFDLGGYEVQKGLYSNKAEEQRIKDIISGILSNDEIVTDSIIVRGGCSPEGSDEYNSRLSAKRAENVSEMINKIIAEYQDHRSRLLIHPFWEDSSEHTAYTTSSLAPEDPIFVKAVGIGKDWETLKDAIAASGYFTESDKNMMINEINEGKYEALMRHPYRKFICDSIFPLMRKVSINIHFHKQGAINDTIVTASVDSLYHKGLQALNDRDYPAALEALSGYKDYNSALAYLLMEYNHSAIAILENLEDSPERNYLLGIAYARTGRRDEAESKITDAISSSERLLLRSALDPECSFINNN